MSWTPPIGIPAPNWGGTIGNPIDVARPTPPSPWTSNVANVYYVETGGTNPDEGYPGNPRNAIPLTLPAGSVVFINGVYTQSHDPYYIRHAGTADLPCWILSFNPSGPATATQKWILADVGADLCRYLILENIRWDWSATGGAIELSNGVDHVCIRNGAALGAGVVDSADPNYTNATGRYNSSAILVQSGTSHIVVANMVLERGGCWQYATTTDEDPDAHGVSFGFPIADVWVVDCTISYFSGNGVQVAAGSTGSTPDANCNQRTYVGRNTMHPIAQSGGGVKRSDVTVISQNTFHTMRRDTPSSADSGAVDSQYGPRNMWVLYNTVHNCQAAFKVQSGTANTGNTNDTDCYFVGNLIYNVHDTNGAVSDWRGNAEAGGGTAILLRGGINHYVINNTFYDCDAGVLCHYPNRARVIEGNIFANHNTANSYADIHLGVSDTNVVNHNIFTGTPWIRTGDAVFDTFAEVTAQFGATNSNATPTFVNPAAGDFRLAAGSAGVDGFGSTAHAVYDLFQALYGRSIKLDRSGGARPFNGAWDIGAYEFGSSVPPPEPTFSASHHCIPTRL